MRFLYRCRLPTIPAFFHRIQIDIELRSLPFLGRLKQVQHDDVLLVAICHSELVSESQDIYGDARDAEINSAWQNGVAMWKSGGNQLYRAC